MRRSRQPPTFLFAAAVRGSFAPCFGGPQSPAAAAQLGVMRNERIEGLRVKSQEQRKELMNVKRYALIALALLVVDWGLGMLHVSRALPLWSFLLVNFPFGLPFVWLESHWAGTHYSVAGQNVNEAWSFVAFFFSVFAQAWLYSWLIGCCQKRRHALPAA